MEFIALSTVSCLCYYHCRMPWTTVSLLKLTIQLLWYKCVVFNFDLFKKNSKKPCNFVFHSINSFNRTIFVVRWLFCVSDPVLKYKDNVFVFIGANEYRTKERLLSRVLIVLTSRVRDIWTIGARLHSSQVVSVPDSIIKIILDLLGIDCLFNRVVSASLIG